MKIVKRKMLIISASLLMMSLICMLLFEKVWENANTHSGELFVVSDQKNDYVFEATIRNEIELLATHPIVSREGYINVLEAYENEVYHITNDTISGQLSILTPVINTAVIYHRC